MMFRVNLRQLQQIAIPSFHSSIRYFFCLISICLALQAHSTSTSEGFPIRKTPSPNRDYIYVIANGSGTECSYTTPCSSLQTAVFRSLVEQLDVIQILSNADDSISQTDAQVTILSSLTIIGESKTACTVSVTVEPTTSLIRIGADSSYSSRSVEVTISTLIFYIQIEKPQTSAQPLVSVSSSNASEGVIVSLSL